MKKAIVLVMIILSAAGLWSAIFEIVEPLKEDPRNLSLVRLSDADKYDNDGELGALVIIRCGIPDVMFINSTSKISLMPRTGEYWLTLQRNARFIKIVKIGFASLMYDFPEPVQSGCTYTMTIDEMNKQLDQVVLSIISNEDNALVYINGIAVGRTIDTFFSGMVTQGEQEIELQKEGFRTRKIVHNVSQANNRITINLELSSSIKETQVASQENNRNTGQSDTSDPANVYITSEPGGAIVYINNLALGYTPVNGSFAEGTYPLRIIKRNYSTINEKITIGKSKSTKHYIMRDLRATLTINSSKLSTIKLNGIAYPIVNNMRIPASQVEIEVSHPQAKTIKQVITLKDEENKTLDIYSQIEKGSIVIVVTPTSAKIELIGNRGDNFTAIGKKSFNDIPIGTYNLIVSNTGNKTHYETITLKTGLLVQKEITLEAGVNLKKNFVFVEGDTFQMGSSNDDKDEKPVHSVTLSSYYLSKYEVTKGEWEEIMGKQLQMSRDVGENYPVNQVIWYDVIEFCNKASIRDGFDPVYSGTGSKIKCDFSKNGYRLPTEAEWEYSACGGKKSNGYKYSGNNNIEEVAWYQGNSGEKANQVGSKIPNELGLYDMSGNVREWCWDRYGDYNRSSQRNPTGHATALNRLIRGGSWDKSDSFCRTTFREANSSSYRDRSLGFRLARSTK